GDVLRGGQFTLRDLVGPAPFLDASLDEVERIPQRDHLAVIGWRRHVRIGILVEQRLVLLAQIAGGVIMLRGLGTSPFLPAEGSHADERRRRERPGSQEFSARKGFNDEVVLFRVHSLATPPIAMLFITDVGMKFS